MNDNQHNVIDLIKQLTTRSKNILTDCVNGCQCIKWKTVSFTIPLKPEPSHRPRLSGYRVYVPGAAKQQSFFNRNVTPKLNGLFITTPCKIKVDIYVETPKSFSAIQKVLAEQGFMRPWGNIGDVDNFEKAIYDMMQPNEKRKHRGIMANDSLIIEAHTNKYYSITPRYEVTISYMTNVQNTLMKILRMRDDYELPRDLRK